LKADPKDPDPDEVAEREAETVAWIKKLLRNNGYRIEEPKRLGNPHHEIINSPIAKEIEGRYTRGEHKQTIDRTSHCTEDPHQPTEEQPTKDDAKTQLDWYEINDNDARKGIEAAHRLNHMESKLNDLEDKFQDTSFKIAEQVATRITEETIPQVAQQVGQQVGKQVAESIIQVFTTKPKESEGMSYVG